MATYRISGVWKDGNVITHYAVHTILNSGAASRAEKTTKARAIALVEGADLELVNCQMEYRA